MAEYIDKWQAVANLMDAKLKDTAKAVNAIQFMTSADVLPVVRGMWLSKEYMYGDPDAGVSDYWMDRLAEKSDYYAFCSVRGKDAGYNGEGNLILSNYCPHCGAKLEEEA